MSITHLLQESRVKRDTRFGNLRHITINGGDNLFTSSFFNV